MLLFWFALLVGIGFGYGLGKRRCISKVEQLDLELFLEDPIKNPQNSRYWYKLLNTL